MNTQVKYSKYGAACILYSKTGSAIDSISVVIVSVSNSLHQRHTVPSSRLTQTASLC